VLGVPLWGCEQRNSAVWKRGVNTMMRRVSAKISLRVIRNAGCALAWLCGFGTLAVFVIPAGSGGPMSAAQVQAMLAASAPDKPANFTQANLANLDLQQVDFKGANLSHANLFGAELDGANFSRCNLEGANLDRAHMVGAHLNEARLRGASLFLTVLADADLRKADLRGVVAILIAPRVNLAGANLVGAKLASDPSNQMMVQLRTEFDGADLTGARLEAVDLSEAKLDSASFVGASLRNAQMTWAELGAADLTRADVTGLNLSHADIWGAKFVCVKGSDTIKGLKSARNADSAIFRCP
jgi:uncharacterized protein YjbI with pentapeptide repeats